MRRYERYDEKKEATRYWEITLAGKRFSWKEGIIGSTWKRSGTLDWATVADAKHEHDQLVAKMMANGFVPVSEMQEEAPTDLTARSKELENAIRENPSDPAAWLVYADWLQSKGDPRGELVTIQEALGRKPTRALKQAEDRLFDQHAEAFYGPLLFHMGASTHEENARKGAEATWRNGFFEAVMLFIDQDHERSYPKYDPTRHTEVLRDMLDHPSGMFIEELRVTTSRWREYDFREVVRFLASRDPAAPLHTLAIMTEPKARAARPLELGSIDVLLARYPRLRVLDLRGAIEDAKLVAQLPHMRSLRLERVGPKLARSIAAASWPKLESLSLWIGDTSPEALAPLLAGKRAPRLKRLALRGSSYGDELATAVAKSAIVAKLASLDLSGGTMTATGARVVEAIAKKIAGRRRRVT